MGIFLPLTPGVTPKNLLALLKLYHRLPFAAVFLIAGSLLNAQDFSGGEARWYRSNSSGMTLEMIPSRMAALRHEYSLSIRSAAYREIPVFLLPYYNDGYRVELRALYKDGKETRRQWVFRDSRGLARVTAAGSGSLFGGAIPEEDHEKEINSGIIEIRNSEGDVTREFQFDEDLSEWDYRYFYRESSLTESRVLLRAEIWLKAPPLPPASEEVGEAVEDFEKEAAEEASEEGEGEEFSLEVSLPEERVEPVFVRMITDHYRYSRSGSLRAIDRTLHEGTSERLRVGFPRIGPSASSPDEALVSHGGAYTSESFAGVQSPDETTINYTLDARGRVLSEVWRDEDGVIVGELKNTWSGDRLQSMLWKSGDDERLIEYEYDQAGNRTVERNFRQGVLERSIAHENGQDIEELYMNGRVILRAVWVNGMKISEERVLPSRGNPR